MKKRTPFAPRYYGSARKGGATGGKSVEKLVISYGFSASAIETMTKLVPKMPVADMVRRVAKFFLKAESREESRWRREGAIVLEKFLGQPVAITRFKAVSFNVLGITYTPDVWHIMQDGQDVHVEVKGSRKQPGFAAASVRIRGAATLYADQVFILAFHQKGEWSLEVVPPDPDYQIQLKTMAEDMRENGLLEGGADLSFAPRKKATVNADDGGVSLDV